MTIDELLRSSTATLASMRPVATPPVAESRRSAYVHAGRMFYSAEAHEVTTILGSCVAVCVWDSVTGVGGLNHYMLPAAGQQQSGPRFGTYAVPHLIEAVLQLGASRSRLRAKLFGGACVLKAFQNKGGELGLRNVAVARELLAAERVPVVGEDVGGNSGRKLVFRTDDGLAMVRRL